MRWQGGRESDNIEDRRGMPPARSPRSGGEWARFFSSWWPCFSAPIPRTCSGSSRTIPTWRPRNRAPQGAPGKGIDDEGKKFVSVVLAETEDVWTDLFQEMGKTYRKPTLVLFSDQVSYRGLWLRQFRRRAVLLPGRREGLPRPRLLR